MRRERVGQSMGREARRSGIRSVLMTADTVGGVWTYSLELARALADCDIRVHLATMGAPISASQRKQTCDIPGLKVHESHYKLEWMEDPWDDVERAGKWLLDLAARLEPDIVHLNGYAHGALPWRAPCLIVAHSCVLSWWRAVWGGPATSDWDHYRDEVRAGLQAADLTAAPTRAIGDTLQENYGPLRAPLIIPNGCDSRKFRPGRKRPLVLTAGRLWDYAKNIGLLDQVAPSLEWPIYVAGDQCHPDGGVFEAQALRLLGRLSPDELAAWYGEAAIYALPARYEPFGLSALEAGLSGCALVLGDITSLREVWGDAALFVPPDDPEALLNALETLATDEVFRFELAARAYQRALTYTPERMAAAYYDAYNRLHDNHITTRCARGTETQRKSKDE